MGKSFREIVAEVKTAYDITTYIEQSGVALRASGLKAKGLCPFHPERTPSFTVDSQFQNYRCFGCGAAGDIFTYIQETERLDFKEAVEKLALDAGIEFNLEKDGDAIDYASIRACLKEAANYFILRFRELPDSHIAKRQITDRGLSLRGMRYGYAPEGRVNLYNHLREKGYSDEVIEHSGVCRKSEKYNKMYDFWNGRLMFVITDATGKPIGFSARKLFEDDKRGKYVNSVDGVLFHKSSVLFNHDVAKRPAAENSLLYVAEGQFDVASFIEAGLPNVVASSGTAFTRKQAQMCSRMVGENGIVVFAFDGDAAGVKAALSVFQSAPEIQRQAYVAVFPDGLDPCDYRQNNGNEEFRKFIEDSKTPIMDFVISQTAQNYDMTDEIQASNYLEEIAPMLKSISSPVLQRSYVKRVALQTLMDVESIEKLVRMSNGAETVTPAAPDGEQEGKVAYSISERIDEDTPTKENEQKILDAMHSSPRMRSAAMLVALTMYAPRLASSILENDKIVLPKLLKEVVKKISTMSEGSPIIPEAFATPMIVSGIVDAEFFPYIEHMEPEDFDSQFQIVSEELLKFQEEADARSYAAKAMGVMAEKSNDISLLEAAIANDPENKRK